MRIRTHSLFLLAISIFFPLQIVGQVISQTSKSYAEKIYIQTDGLVYTNDQEIWFKAIVLDGASHIPSELSGVLHVQLINAEEKIVQSKLLKLENGVAHGAFSLDQQTEAGKYLIRAYTQWNRNFGEVFFYQQYIDVFPSIEQKGIGESPFARMEVLNNSGLQTFQATFNSKQLDSLHQGKLTVHLVIDDKKDSLLLNPNNEGNYTLNYPLSESVKLVTVKLESSNGRHASKTFGLKTDKISLQFFSEGGSFLAERVNKVAFKSLNYLGKGVYVEGKILNDKLDTVADFKTNHLGMGSVFIQPKIGDRYFALLGDAIYPLPEVKNEASVLNIKKSEDKIFVSAMSFLQSDSVEIEISARGFLWSVVKGKLNKGSLSFVLDSSNFPEGVLAFRLLSNKIPLSQRLYFNYREDLRLELNIKISSPKFKQREKAQIQIELADGDTSPTQVSGSVLVINEEQMGGIQMRRNNLISYLLLDSDLKGNIEEPGYYFNQNVDSTWYDLDALMLTQGWSKYLYTIDSTVKTDQFPFEPEPGLILSGLVSNDKNGKRPRPNVDLTLTTFGFSPSFTSQSTDSLGRFNLLLPDEFGEQMNVLIQTVDKGRQKSFEIQVDRHISPQVHFEREEIALEIDRSIKDLVVKHQERKLIEDAWRVETGITDLGDYVVEDYELTPEREEVMEKFGAPDIVIQGDELRDKLGDKSFGLYNLLLRAYPELVRMEWRGTQENRFLYANVANDDLSLVLVDGQPVQPIDYDLIPNIPLSEVKSFEIIRQPKRFIPIYLNLFGPMATVPSTYSFISIYTYSGKGLNAARSTQGMYQTVVPVFSIEQEFYAPKYEYLNKQDWIKPDRRALIHWEPELKFNEQGVAQVEFYNADNLGQMMVVVELVSREGRISYSTKRFEVEKQVNR